MKSEMELIEQIEAYLNGKMTEDERAAFEKLRLSDASIDQKVVEHQQFLLQLGEYGFRRKLALQMEEAHEKLDIPAMKAEVMPKSYFLKVLWNKYRLNAAVAASVAILAVLGTMLSTGYFSRTSANNSNYSALRREIINMKRSQHALIKNIQGQSQEPAEPAEFGGTGFALSEDGFVVTNAHVINGARSIYIQDSEGDSYKTQISYIDPVYDIAILKVNDDNFKSFGKLPYTFRKSDASIGEKVYTIGFPKDSPVYGEGYLSSNTGYAGDTTAYQVSIPVNPGNSGGPLLDSHGNIIGVVSGKQTQSDGAAFAIKSPYLLSAVEAVPQDSLEQKIVLNKKNGLNGLKRTDQIKKLEDYIFIVKVY